MSRAAAARASLDDVHIPPNSKRLVEALRSMGYRFEEAVADVIDNSVSAQARNVLVRLVRTDNELKGLLIADDGSGMTATRLEEAMRFGADTEQTPDSLSKFGMGMKTAALSQATCLTVATRLGAQDCAMRWTVQGIADDWRCERVSEPDAARLLDATYGDVEIGKHGTVVHWEDLDKVKGAARGDAAVDHLVNKLKLHLGLHLHRFIEDKRLSIAIDVIHVGSKKPEVVRAVEPLNPFGYDPALSRYEPRTFTAKLSIGELKLEAHVWPANSTSRNYKLDNAAKRQGIYFYRNDRLIWGGGWHLERKGDVEPHLSLGRVVVDLPPKFDRFFHLDVKKTTISVPPDFSVAVKDSVDHSGSSFTVYLNEAQKAYRKQERSNPLNHPLVPGSGLSAPARAKLRDALAPEEKRVREVAFDWTHLDDGRFFELDYERKVVKLNKLYRKRILEGRPASSTDAPLVKLLLFLLFREDLDRERTNKKYSQRLDQIDRALRAAMKKLDE